MPDSPGWLPAPLATVEELDLGFRLTLLALAAFSTVWITAVGAAVGSFLNVVIYRLPQGMSLVRPKSRCPSCGASIRPGDNVPVIGWLRLRGRCRACGNRISPRYPLVEAATALLFLGLAHFELFPGGANLPGGPDQTRRLGFVLWQIEPALVGLYAYHLVLLTVLLCLSLIALDGFRPPRRLMITALLIGLLSPVLLPILHPVASGLPIARQPIWAASLAGISLTVTPAALTDGVLGWIVGAAVGLLVTGGVPAGTASAADRRGTIAAASLIGVFLGWQAAIACGLLAATAAIANALIRRVSGTSLPVTGLLAATTLVQIPLWKSLLAYEWWPGHHGWPILRSLGWPESGFAVTSLTAAAVVAGVLAFLAGRIAGHPSRKPSPPPEPAQDAAALTEEPKPVS